MKIRYARRFSEAIGSWLHLEFLCNRAGLFSENSLKTAVGMVMSSLRPEQEGARVHADIAHTALNPGKLKGRKREVDFAQVLIEKQIQKGLAGVFVETKWAGSTHASPSNIFEDFLRLLPIPPMSVHESA